MKKLVFMCIYLFASTCLVFTLSWKRETIYIVNNSTQKIIIEYELRHGDSEEVFNYGWRQEIEGIPVSVFDSLFNEKRSILLPSKEWDILFYYPAVELSKLKEAYEKLSALPLSLKLNAIYTTLVISTEDGTILATLDTISEIPVSMPCERKYVLEIGDNKLKANENK